MWGTVCPDEPHRWDTADGEAQGFPGSQCTSPVLSPPAELLSGGKRQVGQCTPLPRRSAPRRPSWWRPTRATLAAPKADRLTAGTTCKRWGQDCKNQHPSGNLVRTIPLLGVGASVMLTQSSSTETRKSSWLQVRELKRKVCIQQLVWKYIGIPISYKRVHSTMPKDGSLKKSVLKNPSIALKVEPEGQWIQEWRGRRSKHLHRTQGSRLLIAARNWRTTKTTNDGTWLSYK